jgi:hypothetical protein
VTHYSHRFKTDAEKNTSILERAKEECSDINQIKIKKNGRFILVVCAFNQLSSIQYLTAG